jgi:hypothetical protein
MNDRIISNVINEKLTGEAQKNALDFIDYLGSDVSLIDKEWCWEVIYKDEKVFFLRIGGFQDEPNWLAWSADDYSNIDIDEKYKTIAWNNLCTCGKCGGQCAPGRRAVIFGKEFENCCTSAIMFINPDGDNLDCLKKLADIRKHRILGPAE